MALSGSVTVAATNWDDLVFSWTAVQDKATKSSTVSWKMELVAKDFGQIIATPGSPWTVTIDGHEFSGTTDIAIGNNETKTLAEGEAVLQHEPDGTRSFEFSFSQTFYITFGDQSIGVITGEGTGELDRIGFDIVSWLWGYLLALCGRPIRWPSREPVAYLYNGVRLPKMPEVDGYPFRFIRVHPFTVPGAYALYCLSEVSYVESTGSAQNIVITEENCVYFDTFDEDWVNVVGGWISHPVPAGSVAFQDWTIWANFTMYNRDGSVCIEASNPVPVYE